ncbi:TPA: hypothetical protein ACPEYZ_004550, partial [Escherichia coli]
PMLPLYPDISPEIIAIAIGSGAIGCTIVTDSLFWLVKQYCGATLNETFKYYTTATFIASFRLCKNGWKRNINNRSAGNCY